ncbi:MAG: HAD-IB family phosphatase [Patescibacteria group bacterium]
MQKKKFAVFDIDGTIFRSSLTVELVDALIQEGVFPGRVRDVYARAYQQWLDRRASYENYMWAVVKAYNENLKGVLHRDVVRVARTVAAFHKNRVYRFTRDLLKKLRAQDYYLVAVSHSSAIIVREFCTRLGFHKFYGRLHEVDEAGKLTGKHLAEELIDSKSKLVEHLIEKKGLSLKGSVGVGDTEYDIPMLALVEQPICFNPNMQLYRHARQKGWTIIVERKDVIYNLTKHRHAHNVE